MDEIGEAQAHDLGRVIYQLAGGLGKSRLTKEATLRAPRTWRVLMLSTGEVPIQAAIESAGRRARGGQLVRMVDIPASGDDGDVIHDTHGLAPADLVQHVKRACARHYGKAGPAFLRWLCRQGSNSELCRRVQEDLEKAHSGLLPPGSVEEVGRVVRRFALVLVAGKLACEANVLPFTALEIKRAVRLVLRRWLDAHGTGPMERALEQLREFLLRNEARMRDKHEGMHSVRDCIGYRDSSKDLFLLTKDGAKEALEGFSVQDVMKYLRSQGLLFMNEEDRLLSSHRIGGFDRAVRLYAINASLLGDEKAPANGGDERVWSGYEPEPNG